MMTVPYTKLSAELEGLELDWTVLTQTLPILILVARLIVGRRAGANCYTGHNLPSWLQNTRPFQ